MGNIFLWKYVLCWLSVRIVCCVCVFSLFLYVIEPLSRKAGQGRRGEGGGGASEVKKVSERRANFAFLASEKG